MEHKEVDDSLLGPSTSASTLMYRSTGSGSDTRLIEIFEKEIDREIAEKMGAISEIADNIKKCQQTLDRLRKEVVVKYYMSSPQNIEADEQPSIHPAVKKIIGKRPRDASQTEQFMTSNITEWKRETRKKHLNKNFNKHKNTPKLKVAESTNSESLIKPRYVPPNIPGNPQENSSLRGNTKKMHMRVLVGNVAKPIQTDEDVFDPATHKWMVYVRSAPGSLAVEREVARVHFFLHPSYKPHDIVTVPSPPFTLNRRGWGEFPMRVQLHFKNRLNKPADIIHHLKLNGARSGHHTRSAETFADLWLYPYEKDQENKVDKDSCSENILWLASDMLKEEVPDFTSEVICSRCQTTSQGTDSHNCTCNIKDSTQDSGSVDDTCESTGSSSDESESDDSTEDSVLPKPLTCWDASSDIDMAEIAQAVLEEEIKDELTSGLVDETGACLLHENQSEQSIKEEISGEERSCIIKEKKVEIDLTSPSFFSLASNVGQFAKVESDFLNVEASDIMDALEIKQEVKETQENIESFNESLGPIKVEDNNPISINSDFSTLKMDDLSKIEEEPMNVNNQLDEKINFSNYCEINSMPESEVSDTKLTNNDLSPQISNQSINSIPDSYMMFEEVPIDEFINNIVEEEIVVEVPEVSAENNVQREKLDVDPQPTTLLSTIHSSSVEKYPLKITAPNAEETLQVKQNNPITSKPKEITPQIRTVSVPPLSTSKSPKGLLVKGTLPNSNQHFKTISKLVKVQPLQKTENLKDKKGLAINSSEFFTSNGPIKLSAPPSKKVPMKSPIYIQIPKEHLINKQILIQTNQPLKKLKIDHPNQANSTPERNILANQGLLLLKSVQLNSVQTQLKSQQTNSSQLFNVKKTAVAQIVSPRENTQKTSLLKPQFQINTVSKVNIRNPNPNSLLRPVLSKSTTQSNSSNVQLFQNNAKQVLPNTRPLTYSVLKSTVNNANAQSRIQVQNSSSNSLQGSISKSINTTQNDTKKNQLLPQGHKTTISNNNANAKSRIIVQSSTLNSVEGSISKPINTTQSCTNSLVKNQLLGVPQGHKTKIPNNNTIAQSRIIVQRSTLNPVEGSISKPIKTTQKCINSLVKNQLILGHKTKISNNNIIAQSRIKVQSSTLNSVEGSASKSINSTQNCINSLVKNQMFPQGLKTTIPAKVSQQINDSSCNQRTTALSVDENFLGQEILRLSNNVFKEDPKLLESRETRLPETTDRADNFDTPECSAPKSFSRRMYSSDPKLSISNVPKSNDFLNPRILKGDLENKINLSEMEVVKDTVSFNELIKIIHFPKSSIPSRPLSSSSGCEKKEVKTLDVDCVLSCNSLHNDLQRNYVIQPESQFGRKSVMISKDQINSTVNDQILYYLEQLRLLVNSCTFPATEAAVRWLVRGLPLTLADARLVAYKSIHPYCAVSREVYCSWPSFKQAAAEWLRAKTVVRILSALRAKGVLAEDVWSTRNVYWWCRTHGYSPAFCLIGPENTEYSNKDWIQKVEQKSSPTKVLEWMASVRHKVESTPEEEVDVDGVDSQGEECGRSSSREVHGGGGSDSLVCGRPWVRDVHNYIVGQVERLGQEPLEEGGPPQSVAGTLLSHTVAGLAEDMLRRGLANAARRGSGCLEPQDVCRAILKRPEFDVFTGQGLDVDLSFREYLKSLPSPKPP